jgi:F0F1-type ATP synthase membrane subunit b/b'
MNKLYQLIDHLEDALLSGFAVPLTPWALVNGEKLLPLLDMIRDSLPDEIQAAHRVLERREALLHEAHVQSQAMLEEAQHRSKTLLSEHELMQAIEQQASTVRTALVNELAQRRQQAEDEVQRLLAQAEAEAQHVRQEAQAYVEGLLNAAEAQTSAMHHHVLEGQQRLAHWRQHGTVPVAASVTPTVPSMPRSTQATLPPSAHQHQRRTATPGGLSQKALKQRTAQVRSVESGLPL